MLSTRTFRGVAVLIGLAAANHAVAEQVDSRLILNHTQYRFQEVINGTLTDADLRGTNQTHSYMGADGTVVVQAFTNDKFDSVYYGDDERIGMYFVNTPGGGPTQRVLHDRQEAPGLPGSIIALKGLQGRSFHLADDGTFSYMLEMEDGFNFGPALFQGSPTSQSLVTQVGRTFDGMPLVSFEESVGTSQGYVGLDVKSTTDQSIYVGSPTGLNRLVSASDIGTVGGSAVTDLYFGDDFSHSIGDISDDGAAIFRVETADGKDHVYYSDGGTPQHVASIGDIVAGANVQPGFDDISTLGYARVGTGGYSLISGQLANDNERDVVIYGTPGNMKVIASDYSTDGLPPGWSFGGPTHNTDVNLGIPAAVFMDNGDMILPMTLDDDVTSLRYKALIRYDLSTETFEPLVWTEMDASDLAGGNPKLTDYTHLVTGDNARNFAVNSRGDIAFEGTYEFDDPNNPGGRLSKSGLFLLDSRSEALSMIFELGVDELDFGNGFEVVTDAELMSTVSVDPRGKFNNRGDLLFLAESASGEQGYFVIDANLVPEPSTFAIGALASVGFIGLARRRR